MDDFEDFEDEIPFEDECIEAFESCQLQPDYSCPLQGEEYCEYQCPFRRLLR